MVMINVLSDIYVLEYRSRVRVQQSCDNGFAGVQASLVGKDQDRTQRWVSRNLYCGRSDPFVQLFPAMLLSRIGEQSCSHLVRGYDAGDANAWRLSLEISPCRRLNPRIDLCFTIFEGKYYHSGLNKCLYFKDALIRYNGALSRSYQLLC